MHVLGEHQRLSNHKDNQQDGQTKYFKGGPLIGCKVAGKGDKKIKYTHKEKKSRPAVGQFCPYRFGEGNLGAHQALDDVVFEEQ